MMEDLAAAEEARNLRAKRRAKIRDTLEALAGGLVLGQRTSANSRGKRGERQILLAQLNAKKRKLDLQQYKVDNHLTKVTCPDWRTVSPEIVTSHKQLMTEVLNKNNVWEFITKNMSNIEIKKLSQVNHLCFDKIRGLKSFQNSNWFAMDIMKVIPPSVRKYKHNLEFQWKDVQLNITNIPEPPEFKIIESILERRLQTVEKLYIYARNQTFYHNTIISTLRIPLLRLILTSTENLKSLTIVVAILRSDLRGLLTDRNVRDCFERLEEFHIVTGEEHVIFDEGAEANLLVENIKAFSSLCRPKKLKSFIWGRFMIEDDEDENEAEIMQYILTIIEANRETLETLSLSMLLNVKFKEIICPNLTNFKVTILNTEETPILIGFLDKQPKIEELEILESYDFPIEVLDLIQSKSRKWKLQKLVIRSDVSQDNLANAAALEGINLLHLKKFEILAQVESGNGIGIRHRRLLQILPSGLTQLNLLGLNGSSIPESQKESALMIIPELERFRGLTELSLLNTSPSPGNGKTSSIGGDELLQSIFVNITKLKVFRYGNCHEVTNFGLTGRKWIHRKIRQVGISISNLKDLRELVIFNCSKITDFGFKIAVKFPHLKFLYLVRSNKYVLHWDNPIKCPEIEVSTWKSIVRQNPKLDTIVLKTEEMGVGNELRPLNESIRRIFNIYEKGTSGKTWINDICAFRSTYSDTPCEDYYEDPYTESSAYGYKEGFSCEDGDEDDE